MAIPRRERRVEERADEAVPKQGPRLPFRVGHDETLLSGGTVPPTGRGLERSIRVARPPPPGGEVLHTIRGVGGDNDRKVC